MQIIDRENSPHSGLPNKDVYIPNGNIRYNSTEKVWTCMICELKFHKYDWGQITTHANSKHSAKEYRKIDGIASKKRGTGNSRLIKKSPSIERD